MKPSSIVYDGIHIGGYGVGNPGAGGNLDARDCSIVYKNGGRTLATATISRDLQSLQAEVAMEAEIQLQQRKVA